MKYLSAISTLALLGLSVSTPLPTVRLRTIGPDTTQYTPSTQNPSASGHIITLPIGTALSSLAQNPLLLQGIEIVDAEVEGAIFCTANIGYSSQGVVVRSGDGMVMLDAKKGRVVVVTGLSCGAGVL